MRFVIPCGNAGLLHQTAHGTAVVGAVAKKRRDQCGVARNKTTAQARDIAALREAGKGHQLLEI